MNKEEEQQQQQHLNSNSDEQIDLGLVKLWKSLKRKPTVIALDLDYTLWPMFVDCHVTPPLRKQKRTPPKQVGPPIDVVVDSDGQIIRHFGEITKILKTLKEHCFVDGEHHLAIASRSTTRELALHAIELFGWSSYFSSLQIYPKIKTYHMNAIRDELKFKRFEEVLFFDDERSNIVHTSKIGVHAYEVDPNYGLNLENMMDGLKQFESKHH